MSTRKKRNTLKIDQKTIDRIVISQAGEDSAWEPPVLVKRSPPVSLSIPGELGARAAFLARLHREGRVDKWVERVIRERVELEELAFAEVKKRLASRSFTRRPIPAPRQPAIIDPGPGRRQLEPALRPRPRPPATS